MIATDAVTGTGVTKLLAAIDEHSAWLDSTGARSLRRELRAKTEVLTGVRAALDTQLETRPDGSGSVQQAIALVVRRELSPQQAVQTIVAALSAP